jgi:hypothetical protein
MDHIAPLTWSNIVHQNGSIFDPRGRWYRLLRLLAEPFATKCAETADARCLYICMRVCVSMFDVDKPCVSMCAPLRRSMPAGCGVRSCVSMCALRAVRCHAKDPMKFQLGISSVDPRLGIRQRSPAISHTINPVFTTYSRSLRCFNHHPLLIRDVQLFIRDTDTDPACADLELADGGPGGGCQNSGF